MNVKINSIEELVSISSTLDDNAVLTITGAQTKQFALSIVELQEDIRQCHKLLTESGIPIFDQNLDSTVGMVERLKRYLSSIEKTSFPPCCEGSPALNLPELKNAIYAAVDKICNERETNRSYRGNSHHLSQEITEAVHDAILIELGSPTTEQQLKAAIDIVRKAAKELCADTHLDNYLSYLESTIVLQERNNEKEE